jgi:hypothetical protein
MQVEVRRAFLELTGCPIPETQRVTMHGLTGWSRPTTPQAPTPHSESQNVTALDVSVVFEPSASSDGLSIPIEITDS